MDVGPASEPHQQLCASKAEEAVGASAAATRNDGVDPPPPSSEQQQQLNAAGLVHGDTHRLAQEALAASQQQVQDLQLQYDAVQAELDAVSEQHRAVQEELELGRWVAEGAGYGCIYQCISRGHAPLLLGVLTVNINCIF